MGRMAIFQSVSKRTMKGPVMGVEQRAVKEWEPRVWNHRENGLSMGVGGHRAR